MICPYKDKYRVKILGARWDVEVKQWYFAPRKNGKYTESHFAEWLPSEMYMSVLPLLSQTVDCASAVKKPKLNSTKETVSSETKRDIKVGNKRQKN